MYTKRVAYENFKSSFSLQVQKYLSNIVRTRSLVITEIVATSINVQPQCPPIRRWIIFIFTRLAKREKKLHILLQQ